MHSGPQMCPAGKGAGAPLYPTASTSSSIQQNDQPAGVPRVQWSWTCAVSYATSCARCRSVPGLSLMSQ